MRRLPARERRWRCWSPQEASSAAVPFREAKWPGLASRRMSAMSPSSRPAPSVAIDHGGQPGVRHALCYQAELLCFEDLAGGWSLAGDADAGSGVVDEVADVDRVA